MRTRTLPRSTGPGSGVPACLRRRTAGCGRGRPRGRGTDRIGPADAAAGVRRRARPPCGMPSGSRVAQTVAGARPLRCPCPATACLRRSPTRSPEPAALSSVARSPGLACCGHRTGQPSHRPATGRCRGTRQQPARCRWGGVGCCERHQGWVSWASGHRGRRRRAGRFRPRTGTDALPAPVPVRTHRCRRTYRRGREPWVA